MRHALGMEVTAAPPHPGGLGLKPWASGRHYALPAAAGTLSLGYSYSEPDVSQGDVTSVRIRLRLCILFCSEELVDPCTGEVLCSGLAGAGGGLDYHFGSWKCVQSPSLASSCEWGHACWLSLTHTPGACG